MGGGEGEGEVREGTRGGGVMVGRGGVWVAVAMAMVMVWFGGGVEAQQYVNQTFPAEAKMNVSSYDQIIQQAAYAAFAKSSAVTGVKYDVTGDLANVSVQAVRLRVGSLRRYGVTLGRFTIPPGTRITNASSVRVILVYRDFGNVSVYSASVPGQVLVSSLVGIRVYNGDALGITAPLPALTAIALGNPIQVIIPPNAQPSYCVEYFSNGTALATNVSQINGTALATNVSQSNASSSTYACFSRSLGDNYFALVGMPPPGKKSNTWKIILGTVLGVVGLIILLALLAYCCRRQIRKRKFAKMRANQEKGETLHADEVGTTGSRAPVATQTRTRPSLERDYVM